MNYLSLYEMKEALQDTQDIEVFPCQDCGTPIAVTYEVDLGHMFREVDVCKCGTTYTV